MAVERTRVSIARGSPLLMDNSIDPRQTDGSSRSRSNSNAGRSNRPAGSQGGNHSPQVSGLSVAEETPIEKIWQPLFDDGRPTARLGQFLRGLAKHLIDDCEPKNSIVVTPGKLADFYKATELSHELYPWILMFGGRMRNTSIARLFKELRCQHHLVQHTVDHEPTIPGLTPHGFEAWMTTIILAHPSQEYNRLAKAVLAMPICNADDVKERFPKELPRRLFADSGDIQQQQRLIAAISMDPAIQLRNSNHFPPPHSTRPPPIQIPTRTSFSERERTPYSSSSFSEPCLSPASDDEGPRDPSVPIERERKPYAGKEGGGKIYDDETINEHGRSPRRSTTAFTVQQAYSSASHRSSTIPTSSRQHRMSTGADRPPNLRYDGASPIVHVPSAFVRSEGNSVNEIPSWYYTSNIHNIAPKDARRPSRQPSEDERAFPSRKRTSVSNHEHNHGTPSPGSHDSRRSARGTDGLGHSPPSSQPPPGRD